MLFMSTQVATIENKQLAPMTVKSLFAKDEVKSKFKEMLGKRAPQFITSVLQIASQNEMLSTADPVSIYQSAAVAATLDLPLNNNLGFAYIVPYNSKQKDGTWKVVAQFQIGAKGFKQLALRSGQFLKINDTDVREGELKHYDRLTGEIEFEWIQDVKMRLSRPIIGYASYFKLLNGFEKTYYMTVDELKDHGLRFSQTFKKGFGLWKDDFDGMARKTVIKLNLSKNAPLSVDMQKAVVTDQAIVNDAETVDVEYIDNEGETGINVDDLAALYELKKVELTVEEQKNAQRILDNKETASYSKLLKLLQA
jgi:recombination protein RecT